MNSSWKKEPVLDFELEIMGGIMEQISDSEVSRSQKIYSEDVTFSRLDLADYRRDALFWYIQAALQNEPVAVRLVQSIFDFTATAQKAAGNNSSAQYLLSLYYHDGYGTCIDLNKSAAWLKQAALNGSRRAMESIDAWKLMTKNWKSTKDETFYAEPCFMPEGYEYMYMIERHGRLQKEYMEKTHLEELWGKISKLDFTETDRFAKTGNPEKQYQLAWMYDWGLGVPQDMKKAIYWFVEAAFNQYAPAQTELGIMYQYGIMATTMRLEVFRGKAETA